VDSTPPRNRDAVALAKADIARRGSMLAQKKLLDGAQAILEQNFGGEAKIEKSPEDEALKAELLAAIEVQRITLGRPAVAEFDAEVERILGLKA